MSSDAQEHAVSTAVGTTVSTIVSVCFAHYAVEKGLHDPALTTKEGAICTIKYMQILSEWLTDSVVHSELQKVSLNPKNADIFAELKKGGEIQSILNTIVTVLESDTMELLSEQKKVAGELLELLKSSKS